MKTQIGIIVVTVMFLTAIAMAGSASAPQVLAPHNYTGCYKMFNMTVNSTISCTLYPNITAKAKVVSIYAKYNKAYNKTINYVNVAVYCNGVYHYTYAGKPGFHIPMACRNVSGVWKSWNVTVSKKYFNVTNQWAHLKIT